MEQKTLQDIFSEIGKIEERGITFVNGDTKEIFVSYKELYTKVLYLLGSFQKHGIKENEAVVFQIKSNYEFITAFWACILGKMIPVPVALGTSKDSYDKIDKICSILGKPYVLFDEAGFEQFKKNTERMEGCSEYEEHMQIMFYDEFIDGDLEGSIVKCKSEDIAFIQFSSGSTGHPKGVVLSHGNLVANTEGILEGLELTTKDTCLSWMPLTHDMGLIGFHISPLRLQINQYLMPTSLFIRSPLLWLRKVSEHRIKVLASPNFGYVYYLKALGRAKSEQIDLSCVQTIFNGAEPISLKTCNEFLDTMGQYGLNRNTIFSVYGLAEASLAVAFPKVKEEIRHVQIDGTRLGIGEKVCFTSETNKVDYVIEGRSVKHCDFRITDDERNVTEEDVIGHIEIKGLNVTKGYYKNTEETSSKMSFDGWLDTGDIGFVHNGELVVTGRAKDIIFVNGMNFFSHDIEEIIINDCNIVNGKVAVAGYHNNTTEKEDIIVFLVYRGKLNKFLELADQISALVWNRFGIRINQIIPVMRIPKTTSGKIQRYRLVESYCKGEMNEKLKELKVLRENQNVSATVRDENREKFVNIANELYHIDEDVMNKRLWELEGDSLTAYQFSVQLNSQFHSDIGISDLYGAKTLQDVFEQTLNHINSNTDIIEKLGKKDKYELSPEQERMYLLHKMKPMSTNYNVPIVLKVAGEIDIPRFEKAIHELLYHQDILRTNYIGDGDATYQYLNDIETFHVKILKDQNKEIKEIYYDFVRPFCLEKDLLIRVAYVEDKNMDHYVIFDFHHIVCDGSSCGIMIRNISELYSGGNLPDLSVSYFDYAEWKKNYVEKMDKERKFYLELLQNIPPQLEIKTKQKNAELTDEASSNVFYIEGDLYIDIKCLLSKNDITLYHFLLGAYSILLSFYSDQDEMIIGSPFAARTKRDLFDLVGVFINTIPVPCSLDYDSTFEQYFEQLKAILLSIYNYQDYPYVKILQNLNDVNQNQQKNAIYNTLFTLQNMEIPEFRLGDSVLSVYDMETKDAKFDLSMEVFPSEDNLKIKIIYRRCCFDSATIREMSENFVDIIRYISHCYKEKMEGVSQVFLNDNHILLGKTENDKEVDIFSRYNDVISQYPDRKAIVCGGNQLTYAELDREANRIADYLQSFGIGKDGYIPVIMNTHLDLIPVILGVWKSGNAFVPVDVDYPEGLIQDIIENCCAKITIVQKQYENKILNYPHILVEDTKEHEWNGVGDVAEKHDLFHDVYAIYTSGTTGRHKGVKICNYNLSNYINWFVSQNGISCQDKTMLMSSHCFDLGYTAVFSSILSGAELHILSREQYHDPDYILKYIEQEQITYMKMTPSLLHMLKISSAYEKENILRSVRLIVLGGESLKIEDVREISKKYKNITFMNHYGPTETTIGTIYKILNQDTIHGEEWTNVIGRPIYNMSAKICSHNNLIVPRGVAGELVLIGESVSKGYINNAQLTEEKFFDVENKGKLIRGYHTGDLCRINKNGDIEFINRIDNQIKIHGYRIEILQIENVIRTCKGVQDIVVVSLTEQNILEALCAYVVCDCFIEVLKEEVANKLPFYMIPTYFIKIDSMPITENGKVNLKELPPIQLQDIDSEVIVPENEMESEFIEAWKKVLVKEEVYYTDDFFISGGDSIKAVEFVSELSRRNIKLEVNNVLRYSSARLLLGMIKKSVVTVEQGLVTGDVKLTPIQKRFFSELECVDMYNQSILMKCRHNITKEVLHKAMKAITRQHDALRMRYEISDGNVVQIDRGECQSWEIHEWNMNEFQGVKSIGFQERIKQVEEKMNLETGNLIQLVMNHGKEEYIYISIHHLVIDGVSWRIFIRDLDRACSQIINGSEINLGAKSLSYKEWSEGLYESDKTQSVVEFWNKNDEMSLRANMLYKDYNNGNGIYDDNIVYEFEYKTNNMETFKAELNRVYNTDVSDVLLAAYLNSIKNLAVKDSISVFLESHGRDELEQHIDVSNTIGWFTSIYPISVCVEHNDISGLVIEVKEKNKKVPYIGIGYGILRYIYEKGKYDTDEIAFNYLGDFNNVMNLENFEEVGQEVDLHVDKERKRPYTLSLECMIVGNNVKFRLNYSKRQYSQESIQEIADKLIDTLHSLFDVCSQRDSAIVSVGDFGDDELTMDEVDAILNLLQEAM